MIYKLQLRSMSKGLAVMCVITILTVIGFMFMYPTFKGVDIAYYMQNGLFGFGNALLAMAGLHESMDFVQVNYFMEAIYYPISILISLYILVVSAQSIVKEEETGTILYLNSQPVSRSGIVLQKWIGLLLAILLINGLALITAIATTLVFSDNYTSATFLNIALVIARAALAHVVFASLGLFFSALLRSKGLAGFFTVTLGIISILCGIVSRVLPDRFDFLRYGSPLDYYLPHRTFDPIYLLIALAAVVIPVLLSVLVFSRKTLVREFY